MRPAPHPPQHSTIGASFESADVDTISAVAVVIPARNEEARLGVCLQAIESAVAFLHETTALADVRIVLVMDRCSDRTAEVASRFSNVETVDADFGNVGAARALGVQAVLDGQPDRRHLWLANTDADSVVPRGWLAHVISQANRGSDLVLGTVEPDDTANGLLRQAWHQRHSTAHGHPHVHGANFGIRATTYAELGGWPCCPTGEDTALVRAAENNGTVRICRTGAVPVTTSSRLAGRAPDGFAGYLQRLSDAIEQPALAPVT